MDGGYDVCESRVQAPFKSRGRLNSDGATRSWVGAKKRGILNNRKEVLMATKKITEIILFNSLRLFCLNNRHIVQYPKPL